jgi:hypothetical protein
MENSDMDIDSCFMAAFGQKTNLKSNSNKTEQKPLFNSLLKPFQSSHVKTLSNDIKKSIGELKACFENNDSMLNNRINFIKEEIEIRIQSLHNEIDELQSKFYKKLDDLKLVSQKELKRVLKKNRVEDIIECSKVESDVYSLKLDSMKSQVKNLETIHEEFLNKLSKISFEPCCESVSDSLIGKIESDDLLLGEAVEYRPYTKIDLNLQRNKPTAMCPIGDKFLLVTYNKENKILKLNSHYEKVEEISMIDRMKLNKPTAICSDESEYVYLLNENNTQIVIMDLDMKNIVRVLKYTQYDFENIVSLTYFDKNLYILDTKVLHVFSPTGEFIKQITLNIDYASHMTVNENYIVIVDGNSKIHAYNHDGAFKSIIETNNIGLINSISFINDYLFIHSNDGNFLCYNVNGNIFELSFCRGLNDLRESSTSMFYFSKHIYILLTFERILFVF